MSDTPMTAPTTGADETLEFGDMVYAGPLMVREVVGEHVSVLALTSGIQDRSARIHRSHIVKATAVPDAELAASVRRLKEISEYASAVLILEGDFGRSTAETKRLTALLDARTLPHDWERTDAWLAQQEGRDGK